MLFVSECFNVVRMCGEVKEACCLLFGQSGNCEVQDEEDFKGGPPHIFESGETGQLLLTFVLLLLPTAPFLFPNLLLSLLLLLSSKSQLEPWSTLLSVLLMFSLIWF